MIANFSQVAEVLSDVPDAVVLFAGLLGREMGAKSVVFSGDESILATLDESTNLRLEAAKHFLELGQIDCAKFLIGEIGIKLFDHGGVHFHSQVVHKY